MTLLSRSKSSKTKRFKLAVESYCCTLLASSDWNLPYQSHPLPQIIASLLSFVFSHKRDLKKSSNFLRTCCLSCYQVSKGVIWFYLWVKYHRGNFVINLLCNFANFAHYSCYWTDSLWYCMGPHLLFDFIDHCNQRIGYSLVGIISLKDELVFRAANKPRIVSSNLTSFKFKFI